jgi:uncharacterized membrane protein YvlD (DUF360 family)
MAYVLAIWLTSRYLGGVAYANNLQILIVAAIALALGSIIIVPLLNLLLLPINILTLGSFKWVSIVILLFIVTRVVPGFAIMAFTFSLTSPWLSIPAIGLNTFFAYFLVSFSLTFISNLFLWVFE